ncbi:hypothetical protein [Bacteroides thetaiotaomicron]|uniref:Lipoprotein n=1 Tax=Bacteroides thetaiotaomicron TaxID=818 RepID=A0AAP3SK09_BACT4|nr:hypothetical protein [Bacteroides thetaiotaomicron]MDC2222803.1 hypothetical protein [Bacteroides thetaiotaomicron]MDC2228379.1 hypothetical protein [Bacteroides thetaiotaomicron]MDC2238106.1 hypothetical protein [Bacteroides thetaiotaomicron]
MIRLLYISITLLLLLGSCKRHEILNQEFIFCEATINDVQYKDASTFGELLGYQTLPFATKERFFIERDTIAYLQFKLVNGNDPNDFYYLFGGITYPENEKFPLLNKEYVIKYSQEFETDKSAAIEFEHYLYEQRRNNPSSLPFGVIMLEENKYWAMNDYISLKGSVTFESYNAKNNKYQGYFQLYKEADELGIKDYVIIGQFDVLVKGSNK